MLKTIGKIFAGLFSIVYFFGMCVFMTMTFAANFLSGDYYATILKNIDLKTIKVSDINGVFDGINIDKDDTVEDALISYFTESGVEKKTAIAIIENNEIREIIGNFIGDYINYTAGGEDPKINRANVATVLSNSDVIDALGKKPSDEDIDIIYDKLNDLVKKIIEKGGSKDDNSKRNNAIYINP